MGLNSNHDPSTTVKHLIALIGYLSQTILSKLNPIWHNIWSILTKPIILNMRKFVTLFFFASISVLASGQVGSEMPCLDSAEFTATNYPVRLTNDIKDLQRSLTETVVLYPEDKTLDDLYTYRVRVDCNGKATDVSPLRVDGSGFLKKRLQKEIQQQCTWFPAIHQDYRVTSYYTLSIKVEKGKCKVIEQKKLPVIKSP